jgi:single-stranded DNA-binding protein
VGKLARPHYSDRTGKPFFTAGLAEYPDQGIVPVWHNLKAFGGVARQAAELERGQIVRLTGKSQEDRFRNRKGEEVARPVILLVHIEAIG